MRHLRWLLIVFLVALGMHTAGRLPLPEAHPSDPPAETEPAETEPAETEPAETEPAARAALHPDAERRTDRFGLPFRQFDIREGTVQRRQTFADLLEDQGLAYRQIVEVARASRDVFDVRDIQAGDAFRVYTNPWLQQARYLVYRPNAIRYVVFDLQHPEASYAGERPVTTSWKSAAGTITNSLYQSLIDSGASPELVLELSEVFAWQIDFFRIQRGDRFRVVYEHRSVDGRSIGPGDIVAAMFRHRGETYYGFRFDEGNGPEYFDENGNSLRRQLLKAPLRYSRISSRFTNRRFHPVLKRYRPHHGTDYVAPRGTPVRSVGDGTVLYAGRKGYNGNYVKIRHNATYTTGYLHLARIKVQPGETVKQGDIIGTVGSTGLSTGPHLDYRFWKNGQAVDPYSIDLPPARPVSPQSQTAYDEVVNRLMKRLNRTTLVQPGPAS